MNKTLIALACCTLTSPALACAPLSPALQSTLERSARTFKLDSALLSALIWTESRFCLRARSPVGALGLGQLMPGTARELGVNPHDPHQNIYGAAKYLRQMWNKFNNRTLAIAAYNAGPGAVQRYRGIPPYRETQNYVRRVLGAYPQQLIAMNRMRRVPQLALANAPQIAPRRLSQLRLAQARLSAMRGARPRMSSAASVARAGQAAASTTVALSTTLMTRRRALASQPTAQPTVQPTVAVTRTSALRVNSRPTPARASASAVQPTTRLMTAATPAVARPLALARTAPSPIRTAPSAKRTAPSAIRTAPGAAALPPEQVAAPELATAPTRTSGLTNAGPINAGPINAEPLQVPDSLSLFDDAAPGTTPQTDSFSLFGDSEPGESAPVSSDNPFGAADTGAF